MNRQEYQNAREQIEKFTASESLGFRWLIITYLTTLIGFYLSFRSDGYYFIGQIILTVAFVQHFVIVHECGHNTLLPDTKLNVFFGQLSSLFAILPFYSWQAIHRKHHLLAGWKNEDPTTKIQVDPRVHKLNAFQKFLNRWCWRLWIPLFSIMYRLGTYWNIKAVFQAIEDPLLRKKIVLNILILIVFYGALFFFFGKSILLTFGLGLYLSLAFMDIILLSQHNHIPMPVSHGKFKPHTNYEQVQYTRSLKCPHWLEAYVLFYFNRHELHHCFPSLPAYYFPQYDFKFPHSYDILPWAMKVKQMDALELLFKDSNQTGEEI